MTSQDSKAGSPKRLDASVLASLLLMSTAATAASANNDRLHASDFATRAEWRAARQDARDVRQEQRQQNRLLQPIMTPGFRVDGPGEIIRPTLPIDAPSINAVGNNTRTLFPGQVSTFRTERPNQGRSTYINDAGRTRTVSRALSLDLSSTSSNITLGNNILDGAVTLDVGGKTKTFSAGSKVTAAEFAALNQKLATGDQGLELTRNGAALGGSVNLNLVSDDGATIKASDLVVPTGVTVTGDFARTADGVRITKDVTNFGTITATSSNANKNTAVIGAKNITNELGASISSLASESNPTLNLSLRADENLNNKGSITAAGDLELSAGRLITNQGTASSANGSITLSNPTDANLVVNNQPGTLSATNGAINVRAADYSGTADSIVYGGNLLSQDLNVNAGQGIANVRVNELTGLVNSTGAAAHVSANTDDLVIGTQCLTGDPTYYNTGNIILAGDVLVGETLAIIAGGNITTSNTTGITIRTRNASQQAFDINIIAGANITGGAGQINPPGGPATLPSQSIGSISQNATAPVTISGASTTGGNIDFTTAASFLTIDAETFATDGNGANVTLAAYAGTAGSANGRILFNDVGGHEIKTSGSGTGNNGNISLLAGAVDGVAIRIGSLHSIGGTGTAVGTGDIVAANTQPAFSSGTTMTFATDGSISSGNTLIPSSTIGGGSIQLGQGGGLFTKIDVRKGLYVTGGADVLIGNIGDAEYATVDAYAKGDLTVYRMVHSQGGQVRLLSDQDINFGGDVRADNGALVVAGGDLVAIDDSIGIWSDRSDGASNVSVIAGADFDFDATSVTINGRSTTGGSIRFNEGINEVTNLRADSSGTSGDGGELNIVAFDEISLPTVADFAFSVSAARAGNLPGTVNGNITVVAGADTANAIAMGGAVATGGDSNYTGSVYISASNPVPTGAVTLSATGSDFGAVTSSNNFRGGAISPNSGVNVTREIASGGSDVIIRGGAAGVSFDDVSRFGTFDVESLGNIVNLSRTATVSGAGSNQNTLLWTAIGNISFSSNINLHSTGGTGPATDAGGGIVLAATGTIQSVQNNQPFEMTAPALQSNSGEYAGSITVAAGVDFTRNGNELLITGSSGTNGSIYFDGINTVDGFTPFVITHVDAHSQGTGPLVNYPGGDITLVSSGDMLVDNSFPPFFSASGFGTGANGAVKIISPGIISLPEIDMAGGQGGAVIIRAAQPSAMTVDTTPLTIQGFGRTTGGMDGALAANAQTFSNPFTTATVKGVGLSIASAANITLGNVDLVNTFAGGIAGFVHLESGGQVSVGTINVGTSNANADAGDVTIITNSATAFNVGGGGANGSGVITANAGSTTGDGGTVSITNTGTGGIIVNAVPTTTVTNGNGAGLELLAPNGNLNMTAIGTTINRNAAGANNDGGTISLAYNSLTVGAGAITLNANGTGTGAGGAVSVTNTGTGAAGDITVGAGAGQYTLSVNGATGGTISLDAGRNLIVNGGLSTADNIFLKAVGAVTLGTSIITNDVRVSAGGTLTVNQPIIADPITLTSQTNIVLSADLTADGGILVVAGGNITTTISLVIDGSSTTGNGGNVFMAAGADFTEDASSVTLLGSSATGGNINLNTGGALNDLVTNTTFAGASGGKVTLLAFENGAGTGSVILPAGANLNTTSSSGASGALLVVAGATSGSAFNYTGDIDTAGAASSFGSGTITISAAAPNTAFVSPISKNDASYTGTLIGNIASGGSINIGDVETPFGNIIMTGAGLSTGNIDTSPYVAGDTFGASIFIEQQGLGAFTLGTINADGLGNNVGGAVYVSSIVNGATVGNISAQGGSGGGGHGGSVSLTFNSTSSVGPSSINASGNGTTGDGGTIVVQNSGTGGLTLNSALFAASAGGAGSGGSLSFLTPGPITSASSLFFNVDGSGASNAGAIVLSGSSITTGGQINLQALGSAGTGSISLTASTGDIDTNGGAFLANTTGLFSMSVGGNLDVSAPSAIGVSVSANNVNMSAVNVLASSTAANNNGGFVALSAIDGNVTVGNITTLGNGTGAGGNVTLFSSNAVTFGVINNGTALSAQVDLTAGDTITGTSITTHDLNVGFAGSLQGLNLSGTSNIASFFGTDVGEGLVVINNGANPITLETLGDNMSIELTTTNSASGITIGAGDPTTTGSVTLLTPRFVNPETLTAGSVIVQSTGDLTIVGGGGVITADDPPAGPPGFPSDPPAIQFITGGSSNTLTLNSTMTFNGDVVFSNPGGNTISSNSSLMAGNNNVRLVTLTWDRQGTGNITGNNFIISGITYINTDGNFSLGPTTIITEGRDLAIAARNNIDLTGVNFDLSDTANDSGDLTLIAGYDFTPSSSGQQLGSPVEYTLLGESTGGGNIVIGNLTLTSTNGAGGTLTALASQGDTSDGTITIGTIDVSSANGDAGSVFILGAGAITTGNITATGQTSSGDVTIAVTDPQIVGTPGPVTLLDGVFSGGIIGVGSQLPGAITVGAINSGAGLISLSNGGPSMNINGTLTANNLLLQTSDTGTINLTTTNTLAVLPNSITGDGGNIEITAGDVVTTGGSTLILTANSAVVGNAGSLIYRSGNDLTVGTGGDFTFDGSGAGNGSLVDIRSANNLTISAGGIDGQGASGSGARLLLTAGFDGTGLLTLNDTSFFAAANAQVDGAGGEIDIDTQLISVVTTSGAPLVLSANGAGTGQGGIIQYENSDPTATVFGTPAKAPKGAVNFLDFSATGGATGGHGGALIVRTGGNITVVDAATTMTANPTAAGNWNGGQYTLEAGNVSGKAGALVITSDLIADANGTGLGGVISLTSNNKKAFQINLAGKTPKNGISGVLSAEGNVGVITVKNLGGGVQVMTSNAIDAGFVTMEASLKGTISSAKEVEITAQNLTLRSDAGAIGKKPLIVNATDLVLESNTGSVNVLNTSNGTTTLAGGAKANKEFTLQTDGALVVGGDITNTNGDINLISFGALTINANAQVVATNGGILINNANPSSGEILIGNDVDVKTNGKGDDVIIAIGTPPKKGTVSATPTGITISENGGTVFFGPVNGVVVNTPGDLADVSAKNADVIFSNLSNNFATTKIRIGNGAFIEADPPTKSPSTLILSNNMVAPTVETMQLTPPTVPTILPNALPVSQDVNRIGLNNANVIDLNSASFDAPSLLDLGTISDTGANQAVRNSNDLIISAMFHTDKNGIHSTFSSDNHGVQLVEENTLGTTNKRQVLSEGNVVFAPSKDTTIETSHGTVDIAAGSIALVMQTKHGLAVYDLHDQGKNSIVVNAHNKQLSLTPGRHVMVSDRHHNQFEDINPIELVQYRGLNRSKLDNGWSVYTSEFSIPSACYAVKPLSNLMQSKHPEAKAMAHRLLKTTAVLMNLCPDRGDFVQFFKSQVTAMK